MSYWDDPDAIDWDPVDTSHLTRMVRIAPRILTWWQMDLAARGLAVTEEVSEDEFRKRFPSQPPDVGDDVPGGGAV